jgi:hypothetical protein
MEPKDVVQQTDQVGNSHRHPLPIRTTSSLILHDLILAGMPLTDMPEARPHPHGPRTKHQHAKAQVWQRSEQSNTATGGTATILIKFELG